ncbi:MAG: flagellar hook-associated protein FlgK [Eubacteriales bacterium]
MRSTFFGLEIALVGIRTAQTGLDITGQNIANTNTEGYSRQVVDQAAVYHSSSSYRFSQGLSSKIGQGVTITAISQVRDQFLDARYRKANSEYSTQSAALSVMSDIMGVFDESQTDGLGVMLEDFYTQLQALAGNAGDIEFSGLTRSAAQKVTQTLNQYSKQLQEISKQQISDLSIITSDINGLLEKIEGLNNTIKTEQLQGNISNTALDMRNLYLDKLSEYMNITTENNTDGTVTIKTGADLLIDPASNYKAVLILNTAPDNIHLEISGTPLDVTSGSIVGYTKALNGKGGYAAVGEDDTRGVPYYIKALDDYAVSFMNVLNTINGVGKPLFEGTGAADIKVSAAWFADAGYITATTDPSPSVGMNDNIMRMISALDSPQVISTLFTGTYEELTRSLMSDIGIDTNYMKDMTENGEAILNSIQNQRDSIMSVSINEETVNIMKYQRAFEASSRLMTALDEALDVIINRMGTVGR